jgi:hypothetical protein
LSDFADYVERQQALRYPHKAGASHGVQSTPAATAPDQNAELDELLDALDFTDAAPRVPLKDLLIGEDEDSLRKLGEIIGERLVEGYGEAVFDLGFENDGQSLQLNKEQWDVALERLQKAAGQKRANCQLLLTKNMMGGVEAESTQTKPSKDKDCSGKVLVRQIPTKPEEVIETRIAVVGNGMMVSAPSIQPQLLTYLSSRCWQELNVRGPRQR